MEHLRLALKKGHHPGHIISEILKVLMNTGEDFVHFDFEALVGAKPEVLIPFFAQDVIEGVTYSLFKHVYGFAHVTDDLTVDYMASCKAFVAQGANINLKAIQKIALKCSNAVLLKALSGLELDATSALLSGSIGSAVTLWSGLYEAQMLSPVLKALLAYDKNRSADLALFMFSVLETFAYMSGQSHYAFLPFGFLLDRMPVQAYQTEVSRRALAWR